MYIPNNERKLLIAKKPEAEHFGVRSRLTDLYQALMGKKILLETFNRRLETMMAQWRVAEPLTQFKLVTAEEFQRDYQPEVYFRW